MEKIIKWSKNIIERKTRKLKKLKLELELLKKR
jgi:hypothetical protein